jgi:DNA ligase (NAD+)
MNIASYIKAINKLNKWAYHYYCLDDPIATDKEYDELYQQVVNYEKEHNYVCDYSPTLKVGYKDFINMLENIKCLV